MSRLKKIIPLLYIIPFLLIIVLSVAVFYYIDPEEIVSFVGLENAYLLMFFSSFLGGLTTFNTLPYYSVIFILASAGLNPLYIGIASAAGVMAGDSFSYLLGHTGNRVVSKKFIPILSRFKILAEKRPRLFPLACFVYGSISPLSNDLITISAGLARIPYLKVMIPLALGNLVFNISLAYLAVYSYDFIYNLFIS